MKAALSFKDSRTGFSKGGYNAMNIKTEKLYSSIKDGICVYNGVIDLISDILRSSSQNVSIINNRVILDYNKKDFSYDELRSQFNPKFKYVEHQIRALSEMLKRTNGIIKATTSAGKSEIFIAFLKLTKIKTLIIVPKVNLANQTRERIISENLDCGIVTGACKKYSNENICVSTPQMALSTLTDGFDCVIIDECHHVCSKTLQDFLKQTTAKAIYGFSATPDTNKIDFLKIRQFCGKIIVDIGAQELIDNGVIVRPEISFIPISQPKTLSWPAANDVCIINNIDRNDKIKELAENSEQPVLVLIRNIEHGKYLNSIINNSVFLSGSDDVEYRSEVFKKFESKELPVLIGTIGILSEGISINSIRTLIVAQGGKSDIITVQSIGRALRRDGKEKTKAIVYDFYDYGNKFTESHSNQRAAMYKKTGFKVNSLIS